MEEEERAKFIAGFEGKLELTNTSFEEIFSSFGGWNEIKDCPGRFTLIDRTYNAKTPEELLSSLYIVNILSKSYISPIVKDIVIVTRFKGNGGFITYKRVPPFKKYQYLHTLNNEDGFLRKLKHLRIVKESIEELN